MQISKEEKKAIEYFKNKLKEFKKRLGDKITTEENINLEMILNIIEKQNKELGEKETLYQKALTDLVIAEKMVDEMAEHIVNGTTVVDNVCSIMYGCKEDVLGNHIHKKMVNLIKKFFKDKVEKIEGDQL